MTYSIKDLKRAKRVRLASVPEDDLPEIVVDVLSVDKMGNVEFMFEGERTGTAGESVIEIIEWKD